MLLTEKVTFLTIRGVAIKDGQLPRSAGPGGASNTLFSHLKTRFFKQKCRPKYA